MECFIWSHQQAAMVHVCLLITKLYDTDMDSLYEIQPHYMYLAETKIY